MRYQIPQFIEVEDKIFGPLTFKQAIYIVGGAALCYLVYLLTKDFLPFIFVLVLMTPVLALSLALAFYKINNKPFITILEAAFKYALNHKLYLWKKEVRPVQSTQIANDTMSNLFVPKLSDSKLKDLSWNLDISKQTEEGVVGQKDSKFKF